MDNETIIKNVIASSEIEGNTIDEETISDMRLFLEDNITIDEAIDRVSKRFEEKRNVEK